MSELPPVLVTGGTGFVGSALLPLLVRAGHRVHVFVRASSDRTHLAALPLRWHVGELGDAEAVRAALEAAGAGGARRPWVVHGAATISYRRADHERMRRVNVEGTRAVVDACRRADVGRLCLVSSVVAVGTAPDARTAVDETHAFDGARLRCAYVTTKREAEELVLAAADELDVVAVAPGAIFGPAPEPSNTTRFLARVARSRLPLPAPPGSLSVVGVEDVAEGVRLALERGARGRRYLLTESNWTHGELLQLALQTLGRPGRRPRVLRPLWRALVAVAAVVDRLTPLDLVTPESLRLLGEHFRFDSTRARVELGWRPRPFPQVLARTVAWMRAEGHL